MNAQHMTGLLGEISEAYQALQNVPILEARIRELESKLIIDGQTIAHREERIHHLKQDMDALHAKLRSVEAERDDAGFRLLETEDKLDAIKSVVKTLFHDAGEVLKAVEPPKPAPVPEPVAAPTVDLSTDKTGGTEAGTPASTGTEVPAPAPLSSAPVETPTQSQNASPPSVEQTGSAPSSASTEPAGQSANPPTPASPSTISTGTTSPVEPSDTERPAWYSPNWAPAE